MQETEAVTANPLGTEPVGKLVFKFALPATISLLVNALYNIVDQIFIGQSVGYLGNAATNVIYPLTVIMLAVASLWGDGNASYMSLQLGQGKKENASYGICNVLAVSLGFGLLIMILSLIFMNPLCHLFGGTENSIPYAVRYGRIIAVGFPFVSVLVPLTSCIRADGSPNFAMVGLLIGCGTNIILDALFVVVLGWGVQGAAAATILGEALNAVWCLFYLPRFRHVEVQKKYFRLRLSILKRVGSLGISSFVLQLSFALIATVSNNTLSIFGKLSKYGSDIPVATMGISMKINQVVINIVTGIITGTQPILGYNYGAGQYRRTKQAFKIAVIASCICMAAATLVFQLAPMSLISLFGSESELYNEFARMCLRIFLMFCILNGFQTCTCIFFQAVGKPLLASICTFLKYILLVPLGMIVLANVMGVTGPLWAGPVTDILAFLITGSLLIRNWTKIFPLEKYKPE